ncbi:hypothetical protein C8A00DRAFT_45726 [Chaetomidium leptoderma]|uniref:Uncharacterized protein n=1 Tax=Chaetomidium leptoderma TaxID=669021 RepID=A0AAN6ZUP7_9PEZI|nr:hypothetical protein C8A00DRAFT_45726 [Chaetomidium leptoderma]
MASLSSSASKSTSQSGSGKTTTSTPISAPSQTPPVPLPPSSSLPPPLDRDPTIQFTTIDELFRDVDRTPGDILIVTHIGPHDFATIERERESRRRKFRFRRYYTSSRILIIALPTDIHEQLHLQLNQQLLSKVTRMGVEDAWQTIGSATRRAQGHPGGGGESDSSGGPRPNRAGPDDWPTLVIEAGDSESLTQLRRDMRWWFEASNHQVQIVVLKWEEELPVARPGAMTTRSVATAVPRLQQSITITQTATGPPVYNVTRGALVLSFKRLFLRDPGPGEGDFVFSVSDLQAYANRVWEAVRD